MQNFHLLGFHSLALWRSRLRRASPLFLIVPLDVVGVLAACDGGKPFLDTGFDSRGKIRVTLSDLSDEVVQIVALVVV